MKRSQVGTWSLWALAAAVPVACGGKAKSDAPSSTVTASAGGESSANVGGGSADIGGPSALPATADAGPTDPDGGVSEPSCPANIPSTGSACSAMNSGYPCIYDPSNPCITTLATCENGAWVLGHYAILCPAAAYAGGAGGDSMVDGGAAGHAR